jgi:HEAT repeat protein
MRRSRWLFAFVLCSSAIGLIGCGGSKKDDFEPPPAVALNTTTNTATDASTKGGESAVGTQAPPEKEAKKPNTGSTLPQVPMPPLPKAKPPEKELPAKAPPPPFIPPPMPVKPKEPGDTKEPEKPASKEPKKEFEWPTSVNGRPMSEHIKDVSNSDPAIREGALRALPEFGPNAREPATKIVMFHMQLINEKDPGVRAAAIQAIGTFALFSPDGGLLKDADTKEAVRLLCLTADQGGASRLHAVNTLASFGYKGASAIEYLVGLNMTEKEPAYETRRAVATTLGSIAGNKDHGPSPRALHALTDVLIKDKSAAVRLAAFQSVVALGPPHSSAVGQPKSAIKYDTKAIEGYVKNIKTRLLPYKAEVGTKDPDSETGLVERNPQVEIFARLALMRLDPTNEINDENLNAIAKYITKGNNSGPKIQALSALSYLHERASKKINDVVRALEDEDPYVVTNAVYTLVAMGDEGKPAIEFLEKLKLRGSKKGEEKPKDMPKEYYENLATQAIKLIKEAKKPAVGN